MINKTDRVLRFGSIARRRSSAAVCGNCCSSRTSAGGDRWRTLRSRKIRGTACFAARTPRVTAQRREKHTVRHKTGTGTNTGIGEVQVALSSCGGRRTSRI